MTKLMEMPELIAERQRLRSDGKQVVFTNGCFDLIHPGHIAYLRAARALGDHLILALNSDAAVQKLKGPARPIMSQSERAEVVSALEMVDYVVIFDDVSPQSTIAQLLPDILVKGGDWPIESIIGRAEVEAAGGRVLSLPYLPGSSTTDLVERVIARQNQDRSAQDPAQQQKAVV